MPLLHALVLGIVQGLTEFLPISSSGHLRLVPWLFGWEEPVSPSVRLAFDTSLHLGTLVAVLFYLRREVVPYVRHGIGLVVRARSCDRRTGCSPCTAAAWSRCGHWACRPAARPQATGR